MRYIKMFKESLDDKSLEKRILKELFELVEGDHEDWLSDENLDDFETSSQFAKYLDDCIFDEENSDYLGDIAIDWINSNIEYVFDEYQKIKK